MTWPHVAVAPPHRDVAPGDPDASDGDLHDSDAQGGPRDAGPRDEAVRVRLGASATTPAETLLALTRDPSVMVRAALVLNPSAPRAVLGVLAQDADERVRVLLAHKLVALAPGLTEAEQSHLCQQAIEALGGLVEDVAVRVRAAIAEVVKDMPNAPRELVLLLAHDTAIQVSEPVIRLSPLLGQADLLALLAASSAPRVALAVARRPHLTEDVADTLARTADAEAIRALLLNHSAQIREVTLDLLIARAADHIAWHEPLVRRPHLSPRAAEALSLIVADVLLAELASRADLPPTVAAELRARLATRLGLPPGRGTPSGDPPPDYPLSVPMPASSQPLALVPIDAWTETPARTAAGSPTEADLLVIAGRGEARLAAAMLAVAAKVPLALVERAAFLRSAKGVVSLVWKAGFSMRLAIPLQHLLARLAPGSLLASGPGGSFPLAIEEMRWQLELLGRGAAPVAPAAVMAAGPIVMPATATQADLMPAVPTSAVPTSAIPTSALIAPANARPANAGPAIATPTITAG